VANLGLYRALARYGGFEAIQFLTGQDFNPADVWASAQPQISRHELLDLYAPCAAGVLLRGQPYLDELAWIRRAFRPANAYSLVGLIHTLAPPAVRELIGAVATAPVYPWDALICSSPSVREGLERMFGQWHDYLQHRLGAQQRVMPQLPVIPLGVEADPLAAQSADRQARAGLRAQLGLQDDTVMMLWVGRLSYFEKAFPQGMFRAMQRALERSGVALHLAMAGWFPNGDHDHQLFREAAQICCPDVPVSFLDGSNGDLVAQCWAAADVFLSLVDNVQETFGLSPVEAMAAGLPVVVSDWDGYRATVRDGIDGFRIPTLGGPSGGIGQELAARHSVGLFSYQDYVGAVAQHTAVDVEAAAAALASLAGDPSLRQRMGQAGQQHVQECFAWPVVINQYLALLADLEAIRASAPADASRWLHPLRGDPFADFTHFATLPLGPATLLAPALGVSKPLEPEQLLASCSRLDLAYAGCHASDAECHQLLVRIDQQSPVSVHDLLASHHPSRHQALAMGLVWLAKLGAIRWLNPEDSP
jgi:glycosyltransferase involved in cell wall biosynthesis